ncbi:MAG: polymer-forming cytoskeletal protein [Deltaproteobacteria bacterium]
MALREKKKEIDDRVISVDSAMQGSLTFKDPVHLRINGRFEGTLETQGVLEIGEEATVEATITAEDIVVFGKVRGDIMATKRIARPARAVLDGNIKTPALSIAEGALFQGRCAMLSDVFDTEGLARYLEVDMSTILDWANNGKIPAFKEANHWRFERKKIDEWVSSNKLG